MTPATILYLDYTNGIGVGGGQRSLALLLRHLDRARFSPVLACPEDERLRDLVEPSIPVATLPLDGALRGVSRWEASWSRLARAASASVQSVRALAELIRREQVRLIHANNLKTFALGVAAAANRIPVIWHVRDIFPTTTVTRAICRIGARAATRVLAVSDSVARQFPPSRRVMVLYNAVEIPDVSAGAQLRLEFRAQHGISPAAVLIGYAGRLDPGKGLEGMLRAFAALRRDSRGENESHRLQLALVGDGPQAEPLRALAHQLGVGAACHLVGFQRSMDRAWAAMDICVQPSTSDDAFPRSVIEAMAWAKPVVGSRIGGIAEAIEDGRTGLLHDPGNEEVLRSRLAYLISEPGMAARMGAKGRERALEQFSAAEQSRKVAQLYEDVLGGSLPASYGLSQGSAAGDRNG